MIGTKAPIFSMVSDHVNTILAKDVMYVTLSFTGWKLALKIWEFLKYIVIYRWPTWI